MNPGLELYEWLTLPKRRFLMRQLMYTALSTALVLCPCIAPAQEDVQDTEHMQGQAIVVSTLSSVDLVAVNRVNEAGHNYGTTYLLQNRNEFEVKVALKVVDGINIIDQLSQEDVILKALEKKQVGSVLQEIETEASAWNIDWEVSRSK